MFSHQAIADGGVDGCQLAFNDILWVRITCVFTTLAGGKDIPSSFVCTHLEKRALHASCRIQLLTTNLCVLVVGSLTLKPW